jgi:periplasmic divalent cation tolerance protein
MHIARTTFGRQSDASKMAKKLISLKLCACAHYFEINSNYIWEGKFCSHKEWLLEAITTKPKKLISFIKKSHPYICPMVYSLNASHASKKYLLWAEKNEK